MESGLLPKWEHMGDETGTMVGYPAVAVIADAMTKYPDEFSQEEKVQALNAAIASSTYKPEDFSEWDKQVLDKTLTTHVKYIEDPAFGFAPAIQRDADGNAVNPDYTIESVSYGLENAYYDWCISQIATLAGDDKNAEIYLARADLFKKYFDNNPEQYAEEGVTGFMRPIMATGEFMTPFDPFGTAHETGNYTEGNAWQWTWFAPHDINGLKDIMGGESAF